MQPNLPLNILTVNGRMVVVYEPIAGSANYMRLIVFMFDPTANRHPSWARTPEWLAAYNAALAAPVPDVNLMRAVTDLMTKDALVIPVNQGGRGWVLGNYVKDLCEQIQVLEITLMPGWINNR